MCNCNPFEELAAQLALVIKQNQQILQRLDQGIQKSKFETPINIKRAAELLGVSVNAIYQNPDIPRHKKNGKLLFFESELMAYLKSPSEIDVSKILQPRRKKPGNDSNKTE